MPKQWERHNFRIIDAKSMETIAEVFDTSQGDLIAAAPDLLAACKAALEEGDEYVSMNMIKKAIAKAEGRAL